MHRNSTQWDISGTGTFRLASKMLTNRITNPERDGQCGSNLQNLTKRLKRIYHSDEGKTYVKRDQSGAEARIVAWLCKHGQFRDLFLNRIKPHSFVALHLFKKEWQAELDKGFGGKDTRCNIQELCDTSISKLTSNPFWREVADLIQSSDLWTASRRFYFISKQVCHSCVDDKTEVLTRDAGWVSCKNLKNTQEIAVWNMDGSIKFENPKIWLITPYTGKLHLYDEDELNQCVTPNHRMIYYSNYKFREDFSENIFSKKMEIRIPNNGIYIGGNVILPDYDIQLLVAIQADGYITGKDNVRFRFCKNRKMDRLISIIKRAGYEYTEYDNKIDPCEIYIKNIPHLINYFKEVKLWGSWLLQFSKENLTTLINELSYWDGTYEKSFLHKREAYFTKHYQNAEWIKTICHLVGKQGTINRWSYGGGYTVGINNRKMARVRWPVEVNYNGFVYCPTVSTGAFLVRRCGKVSITGNSNYGIGPGRFVLNTLEKSQGKVVLTKRDAEHYLEFYHGTFPEIREWHVEVLEQVRDTNYLYNLFGHPRYFFHKGNLLESKYKEYLAFIPQSTVATITRRAFIGLQDFIEKEKLDWDLMIDEHDSLMGQCPDNETAEMDSKIKELIECKLKNNRNEEFQMKSESGVGRNWGPYDAVKNPDGLREIYK